MTPNQFTPPEGPARFLDFWVTGILHVSMLPTDTTVGVDDEWFEEDGLVESALPEEHQPGFIRATEDDGSYRSIEARMEYLYRHNYNGFFVAAHANAPRKFHHDEAGNINGCSFGSGVYFTASAYGDTLEEAYKAVAESWSRGT